MIFKYNDFLLERNNYSILNDTEWTYKELLDCVDGYYTDIDRSKDEIEYYLSTLKNLQKSGGEVYRLLYLYDLKHLDKDKLGDHWCIDENTISNFTESLKDGVYSYEYDDIDDYSDEDLKSYMITAIIPPNYIDIKESIGQFSSLPNELEVNLIGNPDNIKIKEINNDI